MPDRLTERFTQLEDAIRIRPAAPAEAVRTRGDRRRRRDAVAAVIAAVIAIGSVGTVVGLSLNHGSATVRPARPPMPVPLAFPAQFTMPHQGEAGWTRNDDRTAPAAINPCGGIDLTLPDRVAAVTMTGHAPYEESHSPTELTEQILLFDGPTTALGALHALDDAARGCGWSSTVLSQPADGGDQTFLMQSYPADRSVGGLKEIRNAEAIVESNVMVLHHVRITGALMSGGDQDGVAAMVISVCDTMGVCPEKTCPHDMSRYSVATPCPEPIAPSRSGFLNPGASYPVTTPGRIPPLSPNGSPVGSPGLTPGPSGPPIVSSGPALPVYSSGPPDVTTSPH
jgi:hypothetical protein